LERVLREQVESVYGIAVGGGVAGGSRRRTGTALAVLSNKRNGYFLDERIKLTKTVK
jgi:hypothetical protein